MKTTAWDVTEYLNSDEDLAGFLDAVFEEGDEALMMSAIGEVARAIGMSSIAKETGLSRENLYRTLRGDSSPQFSTINEVLKALHMRLRVEPVSTAGTRWRSPVMHSSTEVHLSSVEHDARSAEWQNEANAA